MTESQKHGKNKLFKILETHIYTYSKNQEILPTLKGENIVCILLEGLVHIVNISYNGEESLIEELTENSIFGAGILNINNTEYQLKAIENCKVLIIDYNKLIDYKNTNYNYFNIFLINVFCIINARLGEYNNRIRILTRKNIRDKLLEYFSNEYKKTHSRFIYLPTNFKALADYLSINRSAMFRELKYLKEENFIKIDKKRITLLYTPNV